MAHTFSRTDCFLSGIASKGIWAGQGLQSARLGFGKFPRKLPGPRTKGAQMQVAALNLENGFIRGFLHGF